MGMKEEPKYQKFEGICCKCGGKFTYYNSIRLHQDQAICKECEKVEEEKHAQKGS